MIRTELEYKAALRRRGEQERFIEQQRSAFLETKLTGEQIAHAMQPTLAFHQQLLEEIEWYERVRAGEIMPIHTLAKIGQLLIALRIQRGITQRELAERLGVSESSVSRDERHEYFGITVERAQRIADALAASLTAKVSLKQHTEAAG